MSPRLCVWHCKHVNSAVIPLALQGFLFLGIKFKELQNQALTVGRVLSDKYARPIRERMGRAAISLLLPGVVGTESKTEPRREDVRHHS